MNENYTELAIEMIKKHEGFSSSLYKDTADKWTIGYGRNLEDNPLRVYEAEYLLQEDLKRLDHKLDFHMCYRTLDPIRKAIILDMAYNLGYVGIMSFKRMWAALANKDYEEAAKEGLDSRWRNQVGKRAVTLMEIMRTGNA